jgi:hypothetical protein
MKKNNTATKATTKKSTTTKAKAAATKPTKSDAKQDATAKVAATKSEAKPTPTPKTETKLSALDAAAKVLASSKEPLNCKELIGAMATKKLWTSPAGKTPHATLYSAILREITTKGKDARFVKTERGRFAAA